MQLLPARRNEIGADKGQQRVTPPWAAPSEQQLGLIDAVDRSIAPCRPRDERASGIHDREHRVE
jgi:hypothetical protein